jgi:methylated-DNA-protein-cysteine methyltransferase-like protein
MREAEGFFARVYDAVRAIPRGRVATYGQVAAILGVPRGARAVGWALRALPAGNAVPWHRVVGAGGRISHRAGDGPERQRRKLRAEGVAVRSEWVVAMGDHSFLAGGLRPRPRERFRPRPRARSRPVRQ